MPGPVRWGLEDGALGWLCVVPALALILVVLVNQATFPMLYLHGGLLLPAFGLLVYGLAVGVPGLSACLSARPLIRLGEASYALYILHQPLRHWLLKVCNFLDIELPGPVQFLGLLVVTLVACLAIFRYLEEPARRLFRSLEHTRP
jgi:peptidoglycan/LPS O-acetylase OafA/YrhL